MALACFLTGSGVGSGVFARGDSAGPDSGATTFLLVRHAERDTLLLGSDPPLSAAGLRRALTLVHALGDSLRVLSSPSKPGASKRSTQDRR